MAHEEGIAGVGDHQVEWLPGTAIKIGQGFRSGSGFGVIERFKHQLAPRTHTGCRPECAQSVENSG